jgi:hypothetical protein
MSQDSGRKQMAHSNWISGSELNKGNVYKGMNWI